MNGEEWKSIEGYDGYEVSNQGRVRRGEKLLKPFAYKNGYLYVNLKGQIWKKQRIHRLVAFAFIQNPCGFQQVNHKDEDKKNNAASNLEWCTPKYNINYGTGIQRRVKSRKQEIPVRCVETGKVFGSLKEASAIIGTDYINICHCLKGRQHTAGGFHWEYT